MLSAKKCVGSVTGPIVTKIQLILTRHLLHVIMPIMFERSHDSYNRDFSYLFVYKPGRIMIF